MAEGSQVSRNDEPASRERGALLVRYAGLIRTVLSGYVSPSVEIEDLAQDFAVHFLSATGEVPDGDLAGWLCVATRNFARNAHSAANAKKRKPPRVRGSLAEAVQQDNPTDEVDFQDTLNAIAEPYRTSLRLKRAGLTYQEIGDATGVSEEGARKRVRRGGELLKERLADG